MGKRRSRVKRHAKETVIRLGEHRCALAGPHCTTVATTVDHWVPLASGGANAMVNLRAACERCNQDKGVMMPDEWWSFVRDAAEFAAEPPVELRQTLGDLFAA